MSSVARLIVIAFAVVSASLAAQSQRLFLSGVGKDDPVQWHFRCDKGQNANKWTTIGVPSNWELQGFGVYSYGRITPPGGWTRVHGVYTRSFTTPAAWKGEAVFLHFEGVMTDARVSINGQSAGPMHQGGYYAFQYNVTGLLRPAGSRNDIQVDVDDESANESVNHAERRGDYWNYGGIFRPVYLEAVPKTFIEHLGIRASATGSLDVDVRLSDLRDGARTTRPASLEMRVLDLNGKPVGTRIMREDAAWNGVTHLSGSFNHPLLWTAETPNLYQLEVRLKSGRKVMHEMRQRFGFRTVELHAGKGLFVNGKRVFLKGFARHSFWPTSGRTLSEQISRDDVNLIKEMNGNAVRSTHYPPDRHFLDACDELGLYVLDELSGWQAHYDTDVGKGLVKAMVEHDANHPSILFWDNGNEGGFNFDLDSEFAKYDPDKRTVLHPWAPYPDGLADTKHYPTYDGLQKKLAADPVLLPTEMLHGLYDGGGGAGLQDYWNAIIQSKAGAGGFIWSLIDEDVKRVDRGGVLDSQSNFAPDGVVGPYREREGSFYTIRQLWSPIIVSPLHDASGAFSVQNRYAFLNADQCSYEWQRVAFARPESGRAGFVILASRTDHGRSLEPGASAVWTGWGLPSDAASPGSDAVATDAIRLMIRDPTGRLIQTYIWPKDQLTERISQIEQEAVGKKAAAMELRDTIALKASDLSLQISKETGMLVSVSRGGKSFSFVNGPRMMSMTPRRSSGQGLLPQATDTTSQSRLLSLIPSSEGDDLVLSAIFNGPLKSVTYRLRSSGWLTMDYAYTLSGTREYFGVGFDYPEANIKGLRFLGEGPAPVYQDRLAGGTLNVWQKFYNDTMAGDPEDLKPGQHFDYPLFKGFYAGVRWLQFNTTEGPITALVEQKEQAPVYVQVFTPKTPPTDLLGQVAVPFPPAAVSFLHAIPAIGNKFGSPRSMGPMGQPAIAHGEYTGRISFYFGTLSTP